MVVVSFLFYEKIFTFYRLQPENYLVFSYFLVIFVMLVIDWESVSH